MRLSRRHQGAVLSAFVFLCAADPAAGQTITRWTLRIYPVGASQPVVKPIELVLGEDVTCNLNPATLTAARRNPLLAVVWNDPIATDKVCVWLDPGTGPLLSTLHGESYEGTLTAASATGTSRESARMPFTISGITTLTNAIVHPPK